MGSGDSSSSVVLTLATLALDFFDSIVSMVEERLFSDGISEVVAAVGNLMSGVDTGVADGEGAEGGLLKMYDMEAGVARCVGLMRSLKRVVK